MTAAQSTTTSQKEGHLSLKTVISYAMSYGSGYQIMGSLVGSYLMVFLTDTFGVPAAAVGVIMVLASVWDAINDPMMGVIADKTHTRFGKYRPYFLWVPACLTVVVILLLSYVHLPFIDDRIHTHNHFEINYVYSGSARQIIDSEQRKLLAGEFCIFAPNMRHNVLVDDTDSLVISIPVRKSTFDSIFGRLMTQNDLLSLFFKNTLYQEHQSNYLLFKTDPADQEITALIRHITIESNSSRKYAAAYVDCLVPQLFYILLRRYSDTVLYYGSGSKDPTQSDFALMLTYVQNHYTDITLTELARLFGYSPEYVSRLFTRNMHQSFNQIVQNLRMQKAAELLRTTSLSISAVTEQCGYTSPDYFTRNFRRHFHCSSTEYRKQTAR